MVNVWDLCWHVNDPACGTAAASLQCISSQRWPCHAHQCMDCCTAYHGSCQCCMNPVGTCQCLDKVPSARKCTYVASTSVAVKTCRPPTADSTERAEGWSCPVEGVTSDAASRQEGMVPSEQLQHVCDKPGGGGVATEYTLHHSAKTAQHMLSHMPDKPPSMRCAQPTSALPHRHAPCCCGWALAGQGTHCRCAMLVFVGGCRHV